MTISGESSHNITIIWDGNVVQKRDRSRDLISREETKDSKHSKTSVVDLYLKSTLFLLGTFVLAEAKRIEKVEWHWVNPFTELVESWVLSRLASAHVMSIGFIWEFTPSFKESNDKDDLPFGNFRNSIPLLLRIEIDRWEIISLKSCSTSRIGNKRCILDAEERCIISCF